MVSADRNDPSFKMLVGRLHNAGVSRRVLQETFRDDPKQFDAGSSATQRRWRRIGAGVGRTASQPQADAADQGLCASTLGGFEQSSSETYGIGKRLREEIESVFAVKLSQETLRPLLGQLKREPVIDTHQGDQAATGAPNESGAEPTTADGLPQSGQNAPENQGVSSKGGEYLRLFAGTGSSAADSVV